jgi:hypothetical protein
LAPTSDGLEPRIVESLADVDAAVDTNRCDTVAVFCWTDVRPLQGAAAWLDWRLCGAVSHALERGDITGERAEVVLMPTRGRLGRRRLFVFGLGSSSKIDDLVAAVKNALDVLRRAGANGVVVFAPRSAGDGMDPEAAFVRAVRDELTGRRGLVDAVLVGPGSP